MDNPDKWPWWLAAIGGIFVFIRKYGPKLDPRLVLVWVNGPLMERYVTPLRLEVQDLKHQVKGDIHKLQRVVVKTQGGEEALAQVNAEDEAAKRW